MKYFNISVDFEDIYRFSETVGNNHPYNVHENSVFEDAIPRFIDLFQKHEIKATFFITGEEVNKKPINKMMLRRLYDSGHEIANHTYHHYFNFSDLSHKEKEKEILTCQKLLEDITGDNIVGFRAPCYDVDQDTLDILYKHGYLYDSSVYRSYLKSFQQIGYFLWNFIHGKKLGLWRKMGTGKLSFPPLFEIPIPMSGFFRLPFYSTVIFQFGLKYFNRTYSKLTEKKLFTFELHSIDLVDYYEDCIVKYYKDIITHPAMKLSNEVKLAIFDEIFDRFIEDSKSITLREYVHENIHRYSR